MTSYTPDPDQPRHWQQAPPPKKKRKVWPWVVLAVLAVIVGGFVACTAAVGSAVDHANQPVSLRYEVVGDTATITYSTASGMSQVGQTKPPWAQQVDFPDGITAYGNVTATLGQAGGEVTCRIINGDRVVATNTATGAFASANCGGK